MVSVFAGGRNAEDVRLLLGQVASVLPGFDVGTRPVVASTLRPVTAAGVLAGGAYGAAFALSGDPMLANAAVRAKVDRWIDLLTAAEFKDSGIVVCFLEAMPPEKTGTEVTTYLREEIRLALASKTNTVHYQVNERMAVAKWRWWFPDTHMATDGFTNLLACRPTGSGSDLWEPVELLNPDQVVFDPRDPEQITKIIENSRLLAGVPKMLRDELDFRFGVADPSWMALQRMGMTDLHRSLMAS